ncbi:MAG: HAD family phosphatase [Bacteroidetes bacterium]|nr:HAD family phosphatase [Bacteroidota bacterium]MBS1628855.1 HAD family phosphatase [Bacteroidota bacterium]
MANDFSGIRNIIFDLGGVLLNLDYSATERAFEELGIRDFRQRFSQLSQDHFFDDWETGKLSRDEFFQGLQHAGCDQLTEAQITTAWNAMLLDFPLRRLQILQQLRLRYELFLLSNTNEIHETAFNELLRQTCGWNSLGHFFEKIYFSHRVGLRKPGKEIYERILSDNQLKAAETLFIDDSPQNIEAAKSLGIRTIFLEKGMSIEKDVFLPTRP